jgi:cobaltochelatase CobT
MPSFTEIDTRAVNAACARTLAGAIDLELDSTELSGPSARAVADAIACARRFELGPEGLGHRPGGAPGRAFDLLVQARAEALGARWLPGIASNLRHSHEYSLEKDALKAWAFAIFLGSDCPDCAGTVRNALWSLAQSLDAPEEFGRKADALSRSLSLDGEAFWHSGMGDRESSQQPEADAASSKSEGPTAAAAEVPEDGTRGDVEAPGAVPPSLPASLLRNYIIFSTRHDRVVQAKDLATPGELARLRAQLDSALLPYRHLVTRLARQLQRFLMSRQRRNWLLDQDDGQLDSSRLARLVADSNFESIFRVEEESPFPKTAVTLLLDNSGSMRGHPITVAALTADILTRSLERCGIKVELLGFTTADSDGGLPAIEWKRAGMPTAPGRLNALRHIVYKPMDTPWRRARLSLGALLKDDLLKENVDGEALGWACQRLLARPETRRVLIVISDGAPLDKSTAAANPRGFLDQHLHEVVAWIGSRTDIELHAIGIGHQVGRYYPSSVNLGDVDQLGSVLVKRLATWLA